jgi:hypothetical protein
MLVHASDLDQVAWNQRRGFGEASMAKPNPDEGAGGYVGQSLLGVDVVHYALHVGKVDSINLGALGGYGIP